MRRPPRAQGDRDRCSHPRPSPRQPPPQQTASRRSGSADEPIRLPGHYRRAPRGRRSTPDCSRSLPLCGNTAGPPRKTSLPHPLRPTRRSLLDAPARMPCSSGRRSRRAFSLWAASSGRRRFPCRPHLDHRCTSSQSLDCSAGWQRRQVSTPQAVASHQPRAGTLAHWDLRLDGRR